MTDIVERLRDGWDLDEADRIEAAVAIEVTRDRLAHLQSLIDEFSDAALMADVFCWTPEWSTGAVRLRRAQDALLGAATPKPAPGRIQS